MLSLCVMATAVLAYYHVLSVRNLNRANFQVRNIQQQQSRVNALLREALQFSRTNRSIIPVLQSAGVTLPAGRVEPSTTDDPAAQP